MPRGLIYISEGNAKLGGIPSLSLPPRTSCPRGIPCRRQCYAKRMEGYRPSVVATWKRNWKLYKTDPDAYFAQVADWFAAKGINPPRFFRWNTGGDIPDARYMAGVLEIARAFPATRFVLFSKAVELLPSRRNLPANLQIIISMWPGWTPPKIPRGYRRAWMQDGTENRTPESAIECPGRCEQCGMCWQLDKVKRDVFFHKH